MKKWIALLLCVLMTVALLPAALAETEPEEPTDVSAETEPALEELPEPDVELWEIDEEPEKGETELFEISETDKEEEIEAIGTPVEEHPEGTVNINSANFPDANFRAWVKANIAGGKDSITSDQAKAVKSIDCSLEHIASLKGISFFPNIEYLYCDDNDITELDLDNNKQLIEIDCRVNKLTKLSISGCSKLKKLDCSYNELTSLNLSFNKALEELHAYSNKLTKVNIENVKTLTLIDVEDNQLTSLDRIVNNPGLKYLFITNNPITKIDVTKCPVLESIYCSGTKIKALDVTKCPKLKDLESRQTNLTAIDVTKCPELVHLDVTLNKITALNVTKNTKLEWLKAANNGITAIDVSKNPALLVLEFDGNLIGKIDVSKNTKLSRLTLCETGISAIDVSNNTNLVYLSLYANSLGEIDISMLSKLQHLDVDSNNLTALNIKNNSLLEYLDCGNNQITFINFQYNPKLKTLYCQGNRMEMLSVGSCPDLETLECGGNRIRALRLTGNTKLKNVNLSTQETACPLVLTQSGGKYLYDMKSAAFFESSSELQYVKPFNSSYSFNTSTGVMTMPGNVSSFKYKYDTGMGDMIVSVERYFSGDFTISFQGYLQFKGTTPYVIYPGAAVCPGFTVRDSNNKVIPEYMYGYTYEENDKPGTAYLRVWLYSDMVNKSAWFKIYMPATKKTAVENVKGGITVTWDAVDGAAGYVIYRRAWSSTTGGWTTFERWNNTTATTWTDTKVYAGTRYQYGVKAYFAQRTDGVTGAKIGGAMDNYNLGVVGPLKTTVRITTRTLKSATGGKKQLTASWEGSSVFSGYELQIAKDSAFTNDVKTVKISKKTTYSTTVKSLSAATTYYVRVRSYHVFENVTYYGEWSNIKSCTTK